MIVIVRKFIKLWRFRQLFLNKKKNTISLVTCSIFSFQLKLNKEKFRTACPLALLLAQNFLEL